MLKRVCDLSRRITLVRDIEYVVVCHVNPPRQRVALTRGSAGTYGPASEEIQHTRAVESPFPPVESAIL